MQSVYDNHIDNYKFFVTIVCFELILTTVTVSYSTPDQSGCRIQHIHPFLVLISHPNSILTTGVLALTFANIRHNSLITHESEIKRHSGNKYDWLFSFCYVVLFSEGSHVTLWL